MVRPVAVTTCPRGLHRARGALVGLVIAGAVALHASAAAQSTDVLNLAPEGFDTFATLIGVGLAAAFVMWLYRVSSRSSS